jgi:hypothetical protein
MGKVSPFLLLSRPTCEQDKEGFPFKSKMYVGTEQGVSIIDIKTNKVVSPQVPTHKEDFICISFLPMKEKYIFSAIFDGLYKIDESG